MSNTSNPPADPALSFAYRAQTAEGATVTGTINAPDADAARWRLKSLSLRVFELEPAEAASKPARLSTDDFVAFNQQLAQLTAAGMPIETGLRLIAQDMRSGRVGRAIEAVAADLERGTPLQEAFTRHTGSFPTLYGRVLEAGVKAGNLPGILLNLGRHMELMQQLRRSLWRAASYPLMALLAFCGVMIFIGMVVVAPMREILAETAGWSSFGNGAEMPWLTRMIFAVAEHMPLVLAVVAGLIVIAMVWLQWVRYSGREQAVLDRTLLWMPLLGPVLRCNLVARWCDAVALGVDAGLDLHHAVDLAAKASGSPALSEDSARLLAAHDAGRPLKTADHREERGDGAGIRGGKMRVLTPTVLAATEMGRVRGDLPQVLAMLTQMYNRNSEHYMGVAIAVLSPLMLITVGLLLGLVIAGMFLPLVKLIQSVSG